MFAIKNVLFYVVGVIILLHTVVHHEHIKPKNVLVIRTSVQTSFTDNILNSFALNQGDGHLEHFVDIEFDKPELLLSDILEIVFNEEINLFIGSESTETYTALNLPPDPLRGPPC